MKKFVLSLAALILLSNSMIFAGGFQLNDHGAKALALGGAFTAIANDPSAIYWNGAGLTQLSGTHIMFGTALISPTSTFRGVSPDVDIYHMQPQVFFPSHFFGSHTFGESFAVGLGFTTPFGLGTRWDDDWIGKYLAIETELKTFIVTPVITYQPFSFLSLSVGFVYSFADVLITRKNSLEPFAGDAFIHLEGKDNSAFGYNAGIMLKPFDFLSLGASFHSEVEYTFEGTATATAPEQLISNVPQGDVTADLKTPMNLAVGLAVDVSSSLKLSADYQFVGWSSYDYLVVNFVNPDLEDLSSPRLYKDSYIIRFGAGYKASDDLSLMAGVYFDSNPVESENLNPSLPDADRLGLSIGVEGKLTENLTVTGSFLFIRSQELTVTNSNEEYTPGGSAFNGTYNSYANILSFSLLYGL